MNLLRTPTHIMSYIDILHVLHIYTIKYLSKSICQWLIGFFKLLREKRCHGLARCIILIDLGHFLGVLVHIGSCCDLLWRWPPATADRATTRPSPLLSGWKPTPSLDPSVFVIYNGATFSDKLQLQTTKVWGKYVMAGGPRLAPRRRSSSRFSAAALISLPSGGHRVTGTHEVVQFLLLSTRHRRSRGKTEYLQFLRERDSHAVDGLFFKWWWREWGQFPWRWLKSTMKRLDQYLLLWFMPTRTYWICLNYLLVMHLNWIWNLFVSSYAFFLEGAWIQGTYFSRTKNSLFKRLKFQAPWLKRG